MLMCPVWSFAIAMYNTFFYFLKFVESFRLMRFRSLDLSVRNLFACNRVVFRLFRIANYRTNFIVAKWKAVQRAEMKIRMRIKGEKGSCHRGWIVSNVMQSVKLENNIFWATYNIIRTWSFSVKICNMLRHTWVVVVVFVIYVWWENWRYGAISLSSRRSYVRKVGKIKHSKRNVWRKWKFYMKVYSEKSLRFVLFEREWNWIVSCCEFSKDQHASLSIFPSIISINIFLYS